MITQNSNNRASGSTALNCDAGLPISVVTPTNTYQHVAGSATGALQTSLTTDAMTKAAMGVLGTNYYLSAAVTTTPVGTYYYAIYFITDSVLDATIAGTTEVDAAGNLVDLSTLLGVTIKAGQILFGNYAKVKIISGNVKCMYHPLLNP
jgi:hypothetical protein